MEQGQTDRKQNLRKSDFEDPFGSPFLDSFWAWTSQECKKVRIFSDLVRDLDFHHFFIGLGSQKASKFNGLKRW